MHIEEDLHEDFNILKKINKVEADPLLFNKILRHLFNIPIIENQFTFG